MKAVFLAGICNSGNDHWQYQWRNRRPGSVWVEHEDWDNPEYGKWATELSATLAAVAGPKLLIAHSLGCLLAAHWAIEHYDPTVQGAFLVAVPDPLGENFPTQARGFSPAPTRPLPMRSIVIASEDDPYATLTYARAMADSWRAEFVNVGRYGHLNGSSGLGQWHEGQRLLDAHFPNKSDRAVPRPAPSTEGGIQ